MNQLPFLSAQSERAPQRAGLHTSFLHFRDFIRSLSAARMVILTCVLVSLTLALLFILMSTPLFTAESSLLVDSTKGQLSRSRDEPSNFGVEIAEVETQLQILKSQKIALLVVDRLGLDRDPIFMGESPPNTSNWLRRFAWNLLPTNTGTEEGGPDRRHQAALRLARATSVSRVGASYVVLVTVTTSNPATSAAIVNALTELYVADRIEARLEAAQRTNLEQERQRELRMRILSSAIPPLSPSSPRRRIILGVAAVFGAFLGLGIAFLRRAMDDRVRSPEQVTSTGTRLLGVVPETRFVKSKLSWRTPSLFQYARLNPLSPFAQNVRKIKSAVHTAKTQTDQGLCLGIVSTMPGEGKSTVAGNLADLLGASGRRTLLLDFDPRILDRKDSQTHGTPPNYSFLGGTKLRAAISPTEEPQSANRDVSASLEELLGSEQMEQFLYGCRREYEYVLLDCPPAEFLPDMTVLTHCVDALIVVAEWGRLPFELFVASLSSLGGGSAKVLGVVLNKVGGRANRLTDLSLSSLARLKW